MLMLVFIPVCYLAFD